MNKYLILLVLVALIGKWLLIQFSNEPCFIEFLYICYTNFDYKKGVAIAQTCEQSTTDITPTQSIESSVNETTDITPTQSIESSVNETTDITPTQSIESSVNETSRPSKTTRQRPSRTTRQVTTRQRPSRTTRQVTTRQRPSRTTRQVTSRTA